MQAVLDSSAACVTDAMTVVAAPSGAFGPLLRTVFEAIFEVFLMCSAGWVLAWKGILDKRTQKQLNRINVSLFTPCLLFSKVAFSLSPAKLRELWIIPLLFVFVTLISALVALSVGTLLRLRRTQRNFAIAASMFNNSNSLPIALMQSLVVTVHGLKWGKDDNKDAMLGRALGYLVLYSTLGMMLRWSYGVHLLSQADEEVVAAKEASQPREGQLIVIDAPPESDTLSPSSSTQALAPPARPAVHPELHRAITNVISPRPTTAGPGPGAKPTASGRLRPPIPTRATSKRFFSSFPNSPAHSAQTSPTATPRNLSTHFPKPPRGSDAMQGQISIHDIEADDSAAREELGGSDSEWGAQRPAAYEPPSFPKRLYRSLGLPKVVQLVKKFWKGFTQFMTMPLYAALASIIVALNPSLQHVLDEHVQPVKGFLSSAGSCSIPITLVVLGAYFHQEPAKDGSSAAAKTGGAPKADDVPKDAIPRANEAHRDLLGEDEDLAGSSSSLSSRSNSTSDIESHVIVPGSKGKRKSPDSQYTVVAGSTSQDFIHTSPSSQVTIAPTPTSRGHLAPSERQRNTNAGAETEDEAENALHPVPSNRSSTSIAGSLYDAFKMRGLRKQFRSLSLSRQRDATDPTGVKNSATPQVRQGETKTVFVAVVSRMILTPILVLPFIWLLAYFDLVHPIFDDPVFMCSTVLLISAPPALTLAQITQAAAGDAFERLISRTIFWAYCVLTPPLTLLYVIVALHFSRQQAA